MIDVLEIQERRKGHPLAVASPQDFAYRKVGEVEASLVVTDPTVSLYCLDHAARRVLFVQVPEDIDLTAAPFIYIAQYDHASRLLAVPYELFYEVAAEVDLRAPLVFIHSTGRAGSTLMSKAFGQIRAVTSLSEPDVYTQAVALRSEGVDDAEIRDLLASATRVLFNPGFTRGSALNVVKFRSFCTEVADLLHQAFPDARALFLYRDLAAYIQSMYRAFGANEASPEEGHAVLSWLATMAPLLAKEMQRRDLLLPAEAMCPVWLSAVHAYARWHRQGIPMLPVRYEDLVADPPGVLATVLSYLGLPARGVEDAVRAFEADSQAGSPLSREAAAGHSGEIDASAWEAVRELLRCYPIDGVDIRTAGLAVPLP